MPTRVGVLGAYEYQGAKPIRERLDRLGPPAQARPAPAPVPAALGKAAIDHLTPGQLEGLMNDHRDASYSAARARLDIANLLKARQQGFRTSETMLTEQKAKHYYDSASDGTLQTVDRHLADLERYLDAVASGDREKGGYRALTPYELEEQAKSGESLPAPTPWTTPIPSASTILRTASSPGGAGRKPCCTSGCTVRE